MSGVFLKREGDVAVLNLGSIEEKAVVFTEDRMNSLLKAVDEVRKLSGLKGLVVTGSGAGMFCAGADINMIAAVTEAKRGEELAGMGQTIFQRIAELPITTVAAISGPCVGGGYELALSCTYRLALALPQTKIGLPEVKIGILPGFGGTQRLPKLIGLQKALDVILRARVVPAAAAGKLGLVDRVLEPLENEDEESAYERLLKEAKSVAAGINKPTRKPLSYLEKLLTKLAPAREIVKRKALQALRKETKGFYPAPEKALESVMYGLSHNQEEGLLFERRLVGELVASPESKALVHVFVVSEDAQKLSRVLRSETQEISVGVLGGGVMGAGIASAFAMSGYPVTVLEPIAAVREKALSHLRTALEKKRSLSEAERKRALDSLIITEDIKKLSTTHVAIEAIVEDLSIKREVLGRLASELDSSAVIATNTSSLSVTKISDGLSNPSRVLGLHFFNPAERMPLVEVVRGRETSDRTALWGAALAAAIGKYPVIVEDVPGFLVNRILTPYLVEAAHLLQQGYSVQSIDSAATSFGMPMGPLRLLDEIGLDTAAKVSAILESEYGERMKGPRFAEALVGLGKLGRKNSAGFYLYDANGFTPDPNIHVKLGVTTQQRENRKELPLLQERLVMAMLNEAVRCLDDGVAGAPGREAAGQIDVATVMGMGFPPFRGGVLFYAEKLGASKVLAKLKHLESTVSPRFAPSDGVVRRGEGALSFFV